MEAFHRKLHEEERRKGSGPIEGIFLADSFAGADGAELLRQAEHVVESIDSKVKKQTKDQQGDGRNVLSGYFVLIVVTSKELIEHGLQSH